MFFQSYSELLDFIANYGGFVVLAYGALGLIRIYSPSRRSETR